MFPCVNIAKFEQTGMLCERGRKYSNGHMRVSYRQRDRLRERDKLMHPRIHDSCKTNKVRVSILIVTNKVRVSILKHSKRQTKKRSQQIGDGD